MAKYTRIEVFLKMKETGVVPVFYHSDLEVCKGVVKACYDGGIRVFEWVNRGDFASELFSELNKYALAELPGMILGAGSVVEEGTAAIYIQAGANFIVSPLLNENMAKLCNRRKVMWAPGCGTISEIGRAEELGAEIVKMFPASEVGGPSFVKAVKGPMPKTNIMPTGGVDTTEANLKGWFSAGVTCVGMGSNLFPKDMIEKRDFAALTQKVKDLMATINKVKN
ncbi:bifunctional 4-hydroxy-2-oxoglutarate aldolase/2-dehydro-3-deoxy-phosphogluconate aldolase [Alkalitalea saponilacus]|uniref:2-dehydro-3-deoxyphosphogluconate aldolase / (4S)-4-hydroxy-2-oxoglutarate aldolase n=1 Tax=Alkalitalea saponilacus TaxID=889453 RepID=A0A1T5G650_9BACT|nr:bifunctional 4-hydroxy-2-oxoglutarate aldolase/2-dehydro-3-deoxy-phosphogluconate aldolase [Alkalitalea saponilacus]ASB47866.1 bifunctional 4-hydroxy-2-oxoglutarate aldolase/2-dehydro-3-deoxy-phosphogluconate aldolase [Alkalitalea saponilacus]SKC03829.1 2-dehydro-3-deoxyphosphogluconate aldolase / (4S)-4-hydroxy-2-oxoglutarate aldolase [Alkalitalea saponilacus]